MTIEWQKVHVFITSTLTDTHAERAYLAKRVLPELQEWCARRKLDLVAVDPHQAITEVDATANANAVRTCLRLIDDCRPFFVCLLGQRYGWAPAVWDVSPATLSEYPHLADALASGASVTEMEILHAVVKPFRDASPDRSDDERAWHAQHSFFYLREPSYVDDLPADPPVLRRIYTDEAEEDAERRAALCEKLRVLRDETIPATGRPVHHYRATWDANARTPELALPETCPMLLDANVRRWQRMWEEVLGPDVTVSGRELPAEHLDAARHYNDQLTRGRLTGFRCADTDDGHGGWEDLGDAILRDLKAAIAERYPAGMGTGSGGPLRRELDQVDEYLFHSGEGFVERPDDFAALGAYVQGDSCELFVVAAEEGMGKSTLLARWIDRCRRTPERNAETTFHVRFVGQSDGSGSVPALLRGLLEELREVAGKLPETATETRTDPDGSTREVEVPFEIPADPGEIVRFWHEHLPRLGERGRTVIVVDAIDQLEGELRDTSWLPLQGLPVGVNMVVSFSRGDTGAEALLDRLASSSHIRLATVDPFDDAADRRKLVTSYLDQYLKELDEQHIERLVAAYGATNPLYLKVLLSELRVLGSAMRLEDGVERHFGATPASAFDAVLRRLEVEPSATGLPTWQVVPLLFGLLVQSRPGLAPSEIVDVLLSELPLPAERRGEAEDAVRAVLRQVRPYLSWRDGRVGYLYESFRRAATARYMPGGVGGPAITRQGTSGTVQATDIPGIRNAGHDTQRGGLR